MFGLLYSKRQSEISVQLIDDLAMSTCRGSGKGSAQTVYFLNPTCYVSLETTLIAGTERPIRIIELIEGESFSIRLNKPTFRGPGHQPDVYYYKC